MLREKGERKNEKKKKRKKKKEEEGELERSEFGGSGRLQKRNEVKKEKWKGMCVEEKKQREKKEKIKEKEMRYVCGG